MPSRTWIAVLAIAALSAACQDITDPGPAGSLESTASVAVVPRVSQIAGLYVADFISTAATGIAMNDAGDVIGTSYTDPGCGPFCLPPQETVAWRGGQRIVLPSVAGLGSIYVRGINNQGLIVGIAGTPGSATRAVVWTPNGAGYSATDIGTLPGHSYAEANAVDNSGRVVGWSRTVNFPPQGAPFVWTQGGGMVNLAAQGFPSENPTAISPNGTVATANFIYQLGNAASVTPVPPPPQGFLGGGGGAVNDNGDQAAFGVTTGGQNLMYLFRVPKGGPWQQISNSPTGHLSRAGLGSINNAMDISATTTSVGVVAAGPSGLAQPLSNLVASSYGGGAVTFGGPMNASGQILAGFFVGRSGRLVRLTPGVPCTGNCATVSLLQMKAVFVQDPKNPGHCVQGGPAHNAFGARVTVADETGRVLSGARVDLRFLDDYWMNRTFSGTTNKKGLVQFQSTGPCGVGAIAVFIDRVVAGTRTFDRTTGTLTMWQIPQ